MCFSVCDLDELLAYDRRSGGGSEGNDARRAGVMEIRRSRHIQIVKADDVGVFA
jgi:hypothetical protein